MIKTVINPRKLEIEWNKGSQDQPGRKLITSHRDQQSKKKIVKVKVGYCKKMTIHQDTSTSVVYQVLNFLYLLRIESVFVPRHEMDLNITLQT